MFIEHYYVCECVGNRYIAKDIRKENSEKMSLAFQNIESN